MEFDKSLKKDLMVILSNPLSSRKKTLRNWFCQTSRILSIVYNSDVRGIVYIAQKRELQRKA